MTVASDSTVKEQTPRDQYTATAGQTDFPYNFIIFDADHLTVQRTRDGSTTTLSRGGGADYTVTNVGEEDGGDVVLNSGANADDVITIERTVPYERVTDFSQSGDYRADDVNTEEDKQVMMLQQLVRDLDRALTLKSETQIDSIELPSPEADKLLGWNSAADAIVNTSGEDAAKVNKYTEEGVSLSGGNDLSVTHNLGTEHISYTFWDTSGSETVEAQVRLVRVDSNSVRLENPTSQTIKGELVIVG